MVQELTVSLLLLDIRLWSLPTRETLVSVPRAHKSMVKDITFLPSPHGGGASGASKASTSKVTLEDTVQDRRPIDEDEDEDDESGIVRDDAGGEELGLSSRFLSCSTDKTVKLWDARSLKQEAGNTGNSKVATKPLNTFMGRIGFK